MKLSFSIWGYFLPFYLPNSLKNQHLKKMKKTHGEWSFYTCLPQMTIVWGMVPEIQSMIDIFFIILDPYLHAYLTNNPKNQNFEIIIIKKKNSWRYHFYTCVPKTTIIWHTVHETWNAADIIWAIFCPFTSLLTMIDKIFQKWNNTLQILSFYTCVP